MAFFLYIILLFYVTFLYCSSIVVALSLLSILCIHLYVNILSFSPTFIFQPFKVSFFNTIANSITINKKTKKYTIVFEWGESIIHVTLSLKLKHVK